MSHAQPKTEIRDPGKPTVETIGSHKQGEEKDLSKGEEKNPHIARSGTLQGDSDKRSENLSRSTSPDHDDFSGLPE